VETFEIEPDGSIPGAAIGLVRDSGDIIEYACLADVYIHVDSPEPSTVRDTRMDAISREADEAIELHLKRGSTLREAAEGIRPMLREQRRSRMNRAGVSGAYWVLSPDPRSADYAVTGTIKRGAGEGVLICSDGYARLACESRRYSWTELMSGVQTLGAYAMLGELRSLEAAPMDAGGFVRISAYDDATAILIE